MNPRPWGVGAALALCILLLSGTFLILVIGLVSTMRQDRVAATASSTPTMPSPGAAAALEVEPAPGAGYAQVIVDYNTALGNALRAMNHLVASPLIDPGEWATQINTGQIMLLYAQAELEQATPPADLLQVHTSMLAIAERCADVIDRAARSLNANDLAALQQIAEPLRTCHTGFSQANAVAQQLDPSLAVPVVSAPQPVAVQRSMPVVLPPPTPGPALVIVSPAPTPIPPAPAATQPPAATQIPAPTIVIIPQAPTPIPPAPTATQPIPTPVNTQQVLGATIPAPVCDPSYPTLCLPSAPDLNCGDIVERDFPVLPPDPHGFDGNQDEVGCESDER